MKSAVIVAVVDVELAAPKSNQDRSGQSSLVQFSNVFAPVELPYLYSREKPRSSFPFEL